MNIVEAIKTENLRISNGNRWMYYDSVVKEWVVLERNFHQKENLILERTENEEKAIHALLEEV